MNTNVNGNVAVGFRTFWLATWSLLAVRLGAETGMGRRFPTDPDLKAKWLAVIKTEKWEPTEYSRICSEHFIAGKSAYYARFMHITH